MKRNKFILVVVLGVYLTLYGCSTPMTEQQLEDVAKNWCMTIRASQVIPVYPLTEDLQPGDVFLVQVPIQKQEENYRKRGFLQLDQLVVRLNNLDYSQFYFNSYFKPYYKGDALDRPTSDPNLKGRQFIEAPLPMAAFPSYTFDVDTSTGLRLALPVKGVPVGLGLMNASSATGAITISDGMTYAIGTEEVLKRLDAWAMGPDVRKMLRDLYSTTEGNVYLRIVTRVYMVGAVEISLSRKKAGGAGVEVGQAPTIHLVNLQAKDANDTKARAEAYQEILDELSKPMASAVPGGGMKIAWASENMVMLKEQFPRLLAIGYLGFDVPILKDGSLGPLIATRDHIDPEIAIRPKIISTVEPVAWQTIFNLYRMLKAGNSSEEKQLAASMDTAFDDFTLPEKVTFYKLNLDGESGKYYMDKLDSRLGYDNTQLSGLERLNALHGILRSSIGVLKDTIPAGLVMQDDKLIQPSAEQLRQYKSELQQQQKLRESLVLTVRQHPATRKALDLYFGDIMSSSGPLRRDKHN
jgi:hypothetical protein